MFEESKQEQERMAYVNVKALKKTKYFIVGEVYKCGKADADKLVKSKVVEIIK